MPASNTLTRELLPFEPTGPGLLTDLRQGHYFTGATGSTTVARAPLSDVA